MKHFLLKFNHGVEIGAFLAYEGHYRATGDANVKNIALDEREHQKMLVGILKGYGEATSPVIDTIFYVIGSAINKLCQISPVWALNFVARSMEMFAVFSYTYVAKLYPEHRETFLEMAELEKLHGEYFSY